MCNRDEQVQQYGVPHALAQIPEISAEQWRTVELETALRMVRPWIYRTWLNSALDSETELAAHQVMLVIDAALNSRSGR